LRDTPVRSRPVSGAMLAKSSVHGQTEWRIITHRGSISGTNSLRYRCIASCCGMP
jgi:hypothetical protein